MGFSRGARVVALALGLASASIAQTTRADEGDASIRMAARELAVTGADAFEKQDYEAALERFQRAEALYKAPSIAVMVARCLARVGRFVESVDKYEETRRMALDANAPEAFVRAVADANAEVEAVRARVARLQLRLPADAPPGTEVELDDKPVPAALLGVDIPVNPGVHRLHARAKGRAPYSEQLSVAEGARQQVDIALSPLVESTASQTPRASRESPSRRPSVLSIAFLSGGAVALAGGTITGIVALGRKSDLDQHCNPGCPASMQDELDSFRLNRTVSYVSFGVGLAAVGVGTYFLLHRGTSSEVRAQLLPGGAAVTGRF